MPRIPVSVNLIVKNCAAALDACLDSLRTFVIGGHDEIVIVDTGSTDDGATLAVARRHGARVIERPDFSRDLGSLVQAWLPQFAHLFATEAQNAGGMLVDFGGARQVALDASLHDCVFWLDSDDTLWEQRPRMLRTVVEQGFGQQYDVLVLDYEYQFDPVDGRCLTRLRRERIVDRTRYQWHGHCHETLVPRRPEAAGRVAYYHDLPVGVRHTAHRQDHRRADVRNYLILRGDLETDLAAGRRADPRTCFYLGNACRGLGLAEEAIGHYRYAAEHGSSPDHQYAAWLYIVEILLGLPDPRPAEALAAARACLGLAPGDPRGYFAMSRAWAVLGQWHDALDAFEEGRRRRLSPTAFAVEPEQVGFYPLIVAAGAAIRLGRLEEAGRLVAELQQARPGHPDARAAVAALAAARAARPPAKGASET